MDRRWLLVVAAALAAVLAGLWWGRGVAPASDVGPLPTSPRPSSHMTVTTELSRIVVHVSGWVARPGLVDLTPGARVGDAVAAAGGVRSGAALDSVNLADRLMDGQQVRVPGPGAPDSAPGGDAPTPVTEAGPLSLNSATAAQLETLPGVGPVLAERIVTQREANGPFDAVEDLLDVSGIGEAKLGAIRELVVP